MYEYVDEEFGLYDPENEQGLSSPSQNVDVPVLTHRLLLPVFRLTRILCGGVPIVMLAK